MAYARSYIHVSPLQTVSIISVVVLLASMLSVAAAVAAEPPPGGYRFGLIHVDAQGNFTKDELIRRAAERSRLRGRTAATTSAALLGGAPAPIRFLSPLRYSESEYLMEVAIQNRMYRAIADTGSSLIWMKPPPELELLDSHRLPRDRCPKSESFKWDHGKCSYDITYKDGFHTWGKMYQETLCFLPLKRPHGGHNVPRDDHPECKKGDVSVDVAIGWSDGTDCANGDKSHNNCDLNNYDGTVGLGFGEQSLVKQLQEHTFSYCLTTYDNYKLPGSLLVGSPDALKDTCTTNRKKGCEVQTTPLLQKPDEKSPSRYYVHLEYIKINDTHCICLPTHPTPKEGCKCLEVKETPNMFIDSGTSVTILEKTTQVEKTPNMFIDSGASVTFLEKTTHDKLRQHLNSVMKKEATKINDTFCWTDTNLMNVPELELELHFAGPRAVLYLQKEKIMYNDDGHPRVCLAIQDHSDRYSVLGNFQQQDIRMHFDVAKNKLSFVAEDCTKV